MPYQLVVGPQETDYVGPQFIRQQVPTWNMLTLSMGAHRMMRGMRFNLHHSVSLGVPIWKVTNDGHTSLLPVCDAVSSAHPCRLMSGQAPPAPSAELLRPAVCHDLNTTGRTL
jgi:hypothetical protein